MATDYFAELKKQPYPLFIAPKPYSFDLNEDMIKILRQEFSTDAVTTKLADATKGKKGSQLEKAARDIFEDYGENWMKRTMQLGDEYSDRTIEVVQESIDRSGRQFMLWPHVPQRFIEIAYLANQEVLKLPIILNNAFELAFRVPQCRMFNQIKEKCGAEVANLMTCQSACLKALDVLRASQEFDTLVNMTASTAKDGYCEFSMKKL